MFAYKYGKTMDTALLTPQSQSDDIVSSLALNMAYKIFDAITPASLKADISKTDIEYALKQMTSTISSEQVFKYLTVNDGNMMQKIILAVQSGMRDVFQDQKVTWSDAPAISKMVKEIGQSLNSINTKKPIAVQVGTHTLLTLIETIVCLVVQMLLPAPEFGIAKTIIQMAFDLLSTNVIPVVSRWNWQKLGCLFGRPAV